MGRVTDDHRGVDPYGREERRRERTAGVRRTFCVGPEVETSWEDGERTGRLKGTRSGNSDTTGNEPVARERPVAHGGGCRGTCDASDRVRPDAPSGPPKRTPSPPSRSPDSALPSPETFVPSSAGHVSRSVTRPQSRPSSGLPWCVREGTGVSCPSTTPSTCPSDPTTTCRRTSSCTRTTRRWDPRDGGTIPGGAGRTGTSGLGVGRRRGCRESEGPREWSVTSGAHLDSTDVTPGWSGSGTGDRRQHHERSESPSPVPTPRRVSVLPQEVRKDLRRRRASKVDRPSAGTTRPVPTNETPETTGRTEERVERLHKGAARRCVSEAGMSVPLGNPLTPPSSGEVHGRRYVQTVLGVTGPSSRPWSTGTEPQGEEPSRTPLRVTTTPVSGSGRSGVGWRGVQARKNVGGDFPHQYLWKPSPLPGWFGLDDVLDAHRWLAPDQ